MSILSYNNIDTQDPQNLQDLATKNYVDNKPVWQITWTGSQAVTQGTTVQLKGTGSATPIAKGAGSYNATTSIWTCAEAGVYRVTFQAWWTLYTAFSTPNYCGYSYIYVNGAQQATGAFFFVYVSSGVYCSSVVTKNFQLNVGDQLSFYVAQSGGSTSQGGINVAPQGTFADIEYLRP
jgi:hypothetical protein